jgi:hypothetical protein
MQLERIEQVEVEQGQVADVVHGPGQIRLAESGMIRRYHVEIRREQFESGLVSIEPLRAMQEQHRLAPTAAAQIKLTAANVDFEVLQRLHLFEVRAPRSLPRFRRMLVRFLTFSEVVNDAG